MLDEIVRWRRDNQPGGQNAGSVFVNQATKLLPGLIDRLGLKGFQLDRHKYHRTANFVQADVGGSNDVDAVMTAVAERVYAETGIAPENRNSAGGIRGLTMLPKRRASCRRRFAKACNRAHVGLLFVGGFVVVGYSYF